MKKLTCISLLILFTGVTLSQNLHMPSEFKNAVKKDTRSLSGAPGSHYWQNKSSYEITAELIPETRTLNGNETITYVNNSPDTLRVIVVRLYQDIYKKTAIRDFEIDARDATDGVMLKSIVVDGEEYKIADTARFSQYGTNITLSLLSPLKPNATVKLEISWSETISKFRNIRTGCYDSTTFFVGYWYPQVAVYDDIHGWDRLNYGGQTEFYNDCNDFDVKIQVPKNFLVWATGELKNEDMIFNAAAMAKLTEARKSDVVQRMATPETYSSLCSLDTSHVFSFSAQNVPDFAFAASDNLFWDSRSVIVDSLTGRRALVQAIYPVATDEEKEIANTASSILQTFSFVYPRIAYPYPAMTVFVNKSPRGGMEFPMMVNDGTPTTHEGTIGLTAHEIAHTYFPFYMGINERRFAWMDEGWASQLPLDLTPGDEKTSGARESNVRTYNVIAGTSFDLPLFIESSQSNSFAYRNAAYNKPACMYDILCDMVGKENFIKALGAYVSDWHQKHPQPHDFFNSMNTAIGKNYNWFWRAWFETFAYPDLSIDAAVVDQENVHVTIQNVGGIPVPVALTLRYSDGSSTTQRYSAGVWEKENVQTFDIAVNAGKQLKSIILGNKDIPDNNLQNNSWNNK